MTVYKVDMGLGVVKDGVVLSRLVSIPVFPHLPRNTTRTRLLKERHPMMLWTRTHFAKTLEPPLHRFQFFPKTLTRLLGSLSHASGSADLCCCEEPLLTRSRLWTVGDVVALMLVLVLVQMLVLARDTHASCSSCGVYMLWSNF